VGQNRPPKVRVHRFYAHVREIVNHFASLAPLVIQTHPRGLSCAPTRVGVCLLVQTRLPLGGRCLGQSEQPGRNRTDVLVAPEWPHPPQPRSTRGTTSLPTDNESESPKSPPPSYTVVRAGREWG
jgi:hypothetical protein